MTLGHADTRILFILTFRAKYSPISEQERHIHSRTPILNTHTHTHRYNLIFCWKHSIYRQSMIQQKTACWTGAAESAKPFCHSFPITATNYRTHKNKLMSWTSVVKMKFIVDEVKKKEKRKTQGFHVIGESDTHFLQCMIEWFRHLASYSRCSSFYLLVDLNKKNVKVKFKNGIIVTPMSRLLPQVWSVMICHSLLIPDTNCIRSSTLTFDPKLWLYN